MSADPKSASGIDVGTLTGLLRSDLERYFFYNGQAGRIPRAIDVWRNFLIPRCLPVTLYRISRALEVNDFSRLAKVVTWINFYLHGVEISSRCDIGAYFYMPHSQGAVIGATTMGQYVVVYHQVTLGAKTIVYGDEGRPRVGDRVLIGSGAKVLGEIAIGNDCQIGANSVVLESLPDSSLAAGVPARILNR